MTRFWLILCVGLVAGSCASQAPVQQQLAPGSRHVYSGDKVGVYTVCDRGNLVYISATGHFQVLPGSCPGGQP